MHAEVAAIAIVVNDFLYCSVDREKANQESIVTV